VDPAFTFAGKTALIFGAANNIGRAIALEFARRGARIASADLNVAGATETAALVRAGGGRAMSIECNVTQDASVRAAIAAVEAELGEIDIAVNNAGILHSGYPQDIPLDEWQRMLDVHPLAAARSCAVLVPKMIARGRGYIVNTASFAGLYPYAINRIPYAVSKAGVLALTQNLAIYLMPKGVRVSCLCPGPVMTTSAQGMKSFTPEVPMYGPGSHLTVKLQAEAARILAEGMCAGRVLILTHDEGLETLREYARSPDDFIRKIVEQYRGGDYGRPGLPPELQRRT